MDNFQAFAIGLGAGGLVGGAAMTGLLKFVQHRGDVKGKKHAIAARKLLVATDEIGVRAAAAKWLMSNNFRPILMPRDVDDVQDLNAALYIMIRGRECDARSTHRFHIENADALFTERLIEILDDWNMSRWVLWAGWRIFRARRLLNEFPAAVERLRVLAGSWYVEAVQWKGHIATHDESMGEIAFKRTKQYAEAYAKFLKVKQDIHLHLGPKASAYKED